jgi:5-methylcytosine-specific restriction protein A
MVVDHIIPHRGNRELFWDTENWQALCTPCHNRKTKQEAALRSNCHAV